MAKTANDKRGFVQKCCHLCFCFVICQELYIILFAKGYNSTSWLLYISLQGCILAAHQVPFKGPPPSLMLLNYTPYLNT